MGTRGCINYNPTIALRQSGYSITHPLMEELITPFVVHRLRSQNMGIFKKIRQAWGNVIKKGHELGLRSYGFRSSEPSYLLATPSQLLRRHQPSTSQKRGGGRAQRNPGQAGKRKERPQEEIKGSLQRAKIRVRGSKQKKKRISESLSKRARIEEDNKIRMRECLKVAVHEMCLRRVERDQVLLKK
ncbi:hypothetical protein CR513_52135, partial [Mucuna pruriens]